MYTDGKICLTPEGVSTDLETQVRGNGANLRYPT